METAQKIEAAWNESQQCYQIAAGGHSLVSLDGDEWYVDVVGGDFAAGDLFDRASIILLGGPRGGEIVG